MKFFICRRKHITLGNRQERTKCPICGEHARELTEKDTRHGRILIDGLKMTPRQAMDYIKNRYGEEVL